MSISVPSFRMKVKEKVKLGKSYLIGGLGSTILGKILFILNFFIIDSIIESPDIGYSGAITVIFFTFVAYFIGAFYFFWGISKLWKIFKELSNIFLVYCGIICYILSILSFLYGFIVPFECYPTGCRWRFSLIQLAFLSFGVILFISSIISFFYELRKIKGESFENYVLAQTEELPKTPASRLLYKIRIEKLGESTEELVYVCGNCGNKDRFEILNEEKGLFRCLNCDSDNYLVK